jgi:tRNA dimethylallyltransferase
VQSEGKGVIVVAKQMNKLVVLLGETASGKSALGLDIAKKYNGEIICSDSWTVRKYMDIGTAKPSGKEQQAIPHHLLDVVEPDEPFTAADFKRLANEVVADVQSRGKLPIMVGGTGLYIDAVVYDYSFVGGEGTLDRDELGAISAEELADKARDQGIDLTDIDVRNKRRIIRAMESGGQKPTRSALPNNVVLCGTKPQELVARIEQRVDTMLAAGLEAEVKRLAEQYGWEAEAMKGIGYREWREYFEGVQTLEQTRARIILATKNLAKRQRTWFKRNPDIFWGSDAEIQAHIADFLRV